METFSGLLVFCAGNSPVKCECPAQRPVTRSFGVFMMCAWTNSWVNNRDAGDLRRHRARYGVTVMKRCIPIRNPTGNQLDFSQRYHPMEILVQCHRRQTHFETKMSQGLCCPNEEAVQSSMTFKPILCVLWVWNNSSVAAYMSTFKAFSPCHYSMMQKPRRDRREPPFKMHCRCLGQLYFKARPVILTHWAL